MVTETSSPAVQERQTAFEQFLKKHGMKFSDLTTLKGDASKRKFYRCDKGKKSLIIMDADPAQGENPEAFEAITLLLKEHQFSVPEIYQCDVKLGFFIVEDFGDYLIAPMLDASENAPDAHQLYQKIIDTLIAVQKINFNPVLTQSNGTYKIQNYDTNRYLSEIKIFVDWYFPEITKRPTPLIAKDELNAIFRGLLMPVINQASCLVLRDYHAENLMYLQERKQNQVIALLDYQDAVIGNPAYDLVSLLQDARRYISPEFEQEMLSYYLKQAKITDTEAFMRDYYILGAQRNLKIIGIFTRLFVRDYKGHYLSLLERVWEYLERDLAQSQLSPLQDWLERWLPKSLRTEIKIAS